MQNIDKCVITYTADELAKILCITRNTIYQQRRIGALPGGLKHGFRRLWRREELAAHSPQLAEIFGSEI